MIITALIRVGYLSQWRRKNADIGTQLGNEVKYLFLSFTSQFYFSLLYIISLSHANVGLSLLFYSCSHLLLLTAFSFHVIFISLPFLYFYFFSPNLFLTSNSFSFPISLSLHIYQSPSPSLFTFTAPNYLSLIFFFLPHIPTYYYIVSAYTYLYLIYLSFIIFLLFIYLLLCVFLYP